MSLTISLSFYTFALSLSGAGLVIAWRYEETKKVIFGGMLFVIGILILAISVWKYSPTS